VTGKPEACPDTQHFLLVAAKSAIAHWTGNGRSSRVLKIDILSVIDVNKNKHASFLTQVCETNVNKQRPF